MKTGRTPRLAPGMDGPRNLLEKMSREMTRINSPSSLMDLQDHATNFALTAWHLSDWIWWAIEATPLGKAYGDIDRFRKTITDECPSLMHCQDICNGFKHVIPTRPKKRTEPLAEYVTATIYLPGQEKNMSGYCLTIKTKKGEDLNGLVVFDSVMKYWTAFLEKRGNL